MHSGIWPGFVDAMTALLLVLIFVLTIFMIVQFMLRETITGQETELNALSGELNTLATALGLEQQKSFQLEQKITDLGGSLEDAQAEIAAKSGQIAALNLLNQQQADQLTAQSTSIASFEQQVASLMAQRDAATSQVTTLTANLEDLNAARDTLISQQEALQLVLAQAREEIDAQAEAARLDAARREALQAMIADLNEKSVTQEMSLADALAQLDSQRGQAKSLATSLMGLGEGLSAEEAARKQAEDRAAALSGQLNDSLQKLSAEEAANLAEQAAAETLRKRLADTETALSREEQARLADAAAAEVLRTKLQNSDAELTAMTLQLEAKRKEAEDTLTLLAAAKSVESDLNAKLAAALVARDDMVGALDAKQSQQAQLEARLQAAEAALAQAQTDSGNAADTEKALRDQLGAALAAKILAENAAQGALSQSQERTALLATAQNALANEAAKSAESLRKVTALNEQVAALRGQLGSLQALLDEAAAKDQQAQVRIDSLGSNLNVALARAAAEQKKRAELEEAERKRLEAEAKALQAETVQLEKYRSEFFGRLRDVLGNREGVRIVGDRFVFSSEVLFEPASADLSPGGKAQIAEVATLLKQVSGEIPSGIDWILRVDGHTDATPLSGQGRYRNNWELSQGRALSVVEYMINDLGFPPERLAATGFGEFQPVASGDTPEALAQNRRIELKLTER